MAKAWAIDFFVMNLLTPDLDREVRHSTSRIYNAPDSLSSCSADPTVAHSFYDVNVWLLGLFVCFIV